MAHTNSHLEVLRLAADLRLPNRITRDSKVPFDVVQELLALEHLQAISDAGQTRYSDTRITVRGREQLVRLEAQNRRRKDRGHKMLVLGVLIAIGAVLAVCVVYLYAG